MQKPWHPQPQVLCSPGTQKLLNEWYLIPLLYPCLLWAVGDPSPAACMLQIGWLLKAGVSRERQASAVVGSGVRWEITGRVTTEGRPGWAGNI